MSLITVKVEGSWDAKFLLIKNKRQFNKIATKYTYRSTEEPPPYYRLHNIDLPTIWEKSPLNSFMLLYIFVMNSFLSRLSNSNKYLWNVSRYFHLKSSFRLKDLFT